MHVTGPFRGIRGKKSFFRKRGQVCIPFTLPLTDIMQYRSSFILLQITIVNVLGPFPNKTIQAGAFLLTHFYYCITEAHMV